MKLNNLDKHVQKQRDTSGFQSGCDRLKTSPLLLYKKEKAEELIRNETLLLPWGQLLPKPERQTLVQGAMTTTAETTTGTWTMVVILALLEAPHRHIQEENPREVQA